MATITGTVANEFIHRLGDNNTPTVGLTEITGEIGRAHV